MDIDYPKWEFEFQQRNRQPALFADMWLRALRPVFREELGLPVVENIDYIFTADAKGWVAKEHKKEILALIRLHSNDVGFLDSIVKKMDIRLRDLKNIQEKIVQSYQHASNEELAALWKEFDKLFVRFIPWLWIPWYVTEEDIVISQVKALLEPYRQKIEEITDFNNALMLLVFPVKKTAFQEEQEVFYELVIIAKREGLASPSLREAIRQYLDRYNFLGSFLFLDVPVKTEESVFIQIKEALDKNIIEEYELKIKASKENDVIKDALLGLFAMDTQLIEKIRWAQEFGWLLTASVEDMLNSVFCMRPFAELLSEKIGVSYDNFSDLESEEINSLLMGEIEIGSLPFRDRRKGIVYKQENGMIEKIYGDLALALTADINKHLQKVDNSITEFKGQPASPGFVEGRVFLALNAQESIYIEDGDILVTSMTTPDFVPAMKKAAAIVTAEGGLLCHAAIISRELKKPCIVGTKVATSILKTGTRIQVDAQKGVVKIIS
jgi:phosphohistidine swiveling domain-containing protein